jgi:hypothetical protein
MHRVSIAAFFLACLILPIPGSLAQVGPNSTEMATGDVWSSREELAYVPREALQLTDPVSQPDPELATGDVWATPKSRGRLAQESQAPIIAQQPLPEKANRLKDAAKP